MPKRSASKCADDSDNESNVTDTLDEQLRLLAAGLLRTQAEVESVKAAAEEAKASNASLRNQLEKQKNLTTSRHEFKSKGNQAQFDVNYVGINDLIQALTALEEGVPAEVDTSIR